MDSQDEGQVATVMDSQDEGQVATGKPNHEQNQVPYLDYDTMDLLYIVFHTCVSSSHV